MRRLALALLACTSWGASCVDTELSLDMQLRSAAITVQADDTITLDLVADVRVGKHALSGDSFIVARADLVLVDDTPVALVSLDRPDGFEGRLEPGESVRIEIAGRSPAGAFPNARMLLCSGGDVRVTATWQAEEQADDPLDPPIMSFGTAILETDDVTCADPTP